MISPTVRVLISYSHDNEPHAERVGELSDALRRAGIDCWIDQYDPNPTEGWPFWMEKQTNAANFIVLVCTQEYHQRFIQEVALTTGRGVAWEANLFRNDLYRHKPGTKRRYLVVQFDRMDEDAIPLSFHQVPRKIITTLSDDDTGFVSLRNTLSGNEGRQLPGLDPEQRTIIHEFPLLIPQDEAKHSKLLMPPALQSLAGRVFDESSLVTERQKNRAKLADLSVAGLTAATDGQEQEIDEAAKLIADELYYRRFKNWHAWIRRNRVKTVLGMGLFIAICIGFAYWTLAHDQTLIIVQCDEKRVLDGTVTITGGTFSHEQVLAPAMRGEYKLVLPHNLPTAPLNIEVDAKFPIESFHTSTISRLDTEIVVIDWNTHKPPPPFDLEKAFVKPLMEAVAEYGRSAGLEKILPAHQLPDFKVFQLDLSSPADDPRHRLNFFHETNGKHMAAYVFLDSQDKTLRELRVDDVILAGTLDRVKTTGPQAVEIYFKDCFRFTAHPKP